MSDQEQGKPHGKGNPAWVKGGPSPNPSGKRRRADSARADGWMNLLTAIGTVNDKRTQASFDADVVTSAEAQELWRGDDIAARVIETVPNEMLRQGYELKIRPGDEGDAEGAREASEEMGAQLEELKADEAFKTALQYERAYGGGAIFPVANDGAADLRKPLSMERIASISHLVTLEPDELRTISYYTDPLKPKFGLPEFYGVVPISPGGTFNLTTEIHESRLIVFPGVRVSRRQAPGALAGWGDSVLTRVQGVLRDFNLSWGSTGALLQDFAQAVYRMAGLSDLIAHNDEDVVKRRIQILDTTRSVLRMMLIDSQDEFQREQTPLSGLPELLDKFSARLAAAADMPLTLLMGQSPGGLNATGASDITFFYDRVKGQQHTKLRPALERLIKMLFLSKAGPTNGEEPEVWSLEFNPLWQPSQKEQIDTRKVQADTDVAYINSGVLTPEEVTASRFGGDAYSFETEVDLEARAKMAAELPPAPGTPGAPPVPGSPAKDKPGEKPAEGENGDEGADEGEDETEGDRLDGGLLPGLHRVRRDFDEDQPRDEAGRFGEGGGASGSSSAGGKGGGKEQKAAIKARTAKLKEEGTPQLATKMHELSKDPEHQPSPANGFRGSEEFRAVTKELKSRGIRTFGALERAMKAS